MYYVPCSASKCDFGVENRGKESRIKKEKIFVEMEKILMKMEKVQKMEKVIVILEKNIVTIRCMFDRVV